VSPGETFVSLTCRACGLTSTVPVDALLDSVAAETSVGTTDSADDAGTVAWTCDACADLTTARLDWLARLTLLTAGATVLDDATDEALPPHPEHPAAGAPMTHDDLLALHELLTTDTWFDQVRTAGCMNP
jgi:hypothetical protein